MSSISCMMVRKKYINKKKKLNNILNMVGK
jgi:hypothetical protein